MDGERGAEMVRMVKAYLDLKSDEAKRAFIDAAIDTLWDLPDGAFITAMFQMVGEDWIEEAVRLNVPGVGREP